MSKLLEYINVLDKNAAARAAHHARPAVSMSAFGLTADEQQAVSVGDRQSLANAIGIAHMEMPALHVPDTVFLPGEQAFPDHGVVH